MSVAGSLALAVAERLERTGGPRAGLVAWKALALNTADGEVRGKALLAGIRCALALRDRDAAMDLVTLWSGVDRGLWAGPVAAAARDLARAGFLPLAIHLSGAESRRVATALAVYTYARCLEVAGEPSAPDVFQDAIARGLREGAAAITTAARVRRMALLVRSWSTAGEALEESARVDPSTVAPAARLGVARVRLLSPSRFVRAGAIGVFEAIVQGDDRELAGRAVRILARWADDAGPDLTPLEVDRLGAVLGGDARSKEALAGRRVGPAAAIEERALDILRGRFEAIAEGPREPLSGGEPTSWAARLSLHHADVLDVAVALRDGAPARAVVPIRALVVAKEAGDHLPREALAVAEAALAAGDDELRALALRLLRAWLASPSAAAPPRGFLGLADALLLAGERELATIARRAAVVRKENGAADALGLELLRVGWELARGDDRAHAIRRLREAKALLDRPASLS